MDPTSEVGAKAVFRGAGLDGDIGMLFQPILEIDSEARVFAIECLSRGPEGSSFEPAEAFFAWARKRRLEQSFDRMCIKNAFREAAHLPGSPCLCVNLHAQTLASLSFPSFLTWAAELEGIVLSRLILEVVEHPQGLPSRAVLPNLDLVRRLGCRIAMDDFGMGSSNFQRLLEWRPDFLKIGHYFVGGCRDDPRRLDILESLSHIAHRFGVAVVAEGIETPNELDLVSSLGIKLVQGYLFSPPRPAESLGQLALGPV